MMKSIITKFSLSQKEVISSLLGDELVDCEKITWSISESNELLIFLTGAKADAGNTRKNVLDKDEKRLEREEVKKEEKAPASEERRERRATAEDEGRRSTRRAADKGAEKDKVETTYFFRRESGELLVDSEGKKITEKMKDDGWQSVTEGEYRVLKKQADKQAERDREKEREAAEEKNAGVEEEDDRREDPEESDSKKETSLAQLAGILCNEKAFHIYLGVEKGDVEAAKQEMYKILSIESRREIDADDEVAAKFKSLKKEYRQWLDADD